MSESETESERNFEKNLTIQERSSGRFLKTTLGKCQICSNNTYFKSNFYYCESCEAEFIQAIASAETFTCCMLEDFGNDQCLHCFLDSFYTNGIRASSVGLKRISLFDSCYLSNNEFPVQMNKDDPANEMEKIFENHFNKSSYEFLFWICSQEEMLNLTPVDRMTLLRRNAGRGRLMWIISESVNVHNVLKLYNCYFDPYDCRSYFLKKIIETLFDYAGYLAYYSVTDQILYYMKLLSLFQIGSPLKITDYCNFLKEEETKLQRPRDLAMTVMNCWSMMDNIGVQIGLLPELDNMLHSLHKLDVWIHEVLNSNYSSELESVNKFISNWMNISDSFREEQSICKSSPPELIRLPVERFSLISILNKQYAKSFIYALKLLVHYVQTSEQKTLISINLTNLMVQQLAWSYKTLKSSFEIIKNDKTSKEFVYELEKCHSLLNSEVSFARVPLLQLIILTDPVADTDKQNLMFWELQQSFMDKLIGIVRTKEEEDYTKAKVQIYEILKQIFRCTRYLEKNRKDFPLLLNARSLLH
ncbi:uncharacterized protein [Centruroides vittatus]|uniref:uncharacterized protein isoform X1 n=1 Tax=Centruroides vittatus TaxID=120091 RepID=UPI0035100E18